MGFLAEWNFSRFKFWEHMAIKKKYRNLGLGGDTVKLFLKNTKKLVIAEVEKEEMSPLATRRIAYYQKLGFKVSPFYYIQPPYGNNKKEVKLHLISYPRLLKKSEFETIQRTLYKEVYGRKPSYWKSI